jgi:branched-chain amino acid transport system permease protein
MLIVLLVALGVPLIMGRNQYGMVLATTVVMYAVLATAWNVIGGMAGQLELGAFAYLGLGAFTSGTLLLRWNITPWLGMLAGGLVAAGFAGLVGYPLFRFGVKEVWYALSSSALVEVLRVTFLMWSDVGGPVERYIPFYQFSLYHMRFASYVPYYYIMLGLLALALFVSYRISRSRLGYYLLALGQNEDAAESLGVNAQRCKLQALMIFAFFGGMTGAVYACIYGYIHPAFFSTAQSTEIAILGIVGGMGVVYGPLTAAILLVSLKEFMRSNVGGTFESLYLAVYAIIVIVIALFRPQGISPSLRNTYEKMITRLTGGKDAARASTARH